MSADRAAREVVLRPFSLLARLAPGPFDGYRVGAVDVPLRARDLSVSGCLIELQYPVVIGRRITFQIQLPGEGWLALRAHTLRVRHSSLLAAKFVSLDAATLERLARGITRAARGSSAIEMRDPGARFSRRTTM